MFSRLRHVRALPFCLLAFFALTAVSAAQNCQGNNVVTWHNDTNRTGWQQNETCLNPANVTATGNSFGLLYQWTVSGSVYAQPLAVSNVPVSGCTTNCPNVVFVATERDMLYAFSTTGQQIWSLNLALNLGQYVDCSTTTNQNQFPVCNPNGNDDGDGDPPSPFTGLSLGVTGTPVIDPNTYTLYVVAAVQNSLDTVMNYYLFAVDIRSGTLLASTKILGSVNGNAPSARCSTDYPNQGQVSFDAKVHIQRSALLLLNGSVYVAFAPYPEIYNGWLFGYAYSSGSFSSPVIFNSTPYGTGGGIWGSGAGPASDGSSIYVATGNGTTYFAETPLDMADSLLRLDPSTLAMLDNYTPGDVFNYPPPNGHGLCVNDEDFGSGGILLIPNFPYNGNSTNLVVNADKQSNLYVANQKSLGGYSASTTRCPSSPNNIQCITTPPIPQNDPKQGYWASAAYWQYTTGSTTNYMLYYSVTTQNTGAAPKALNGYSLSTTGPPIPSTYSSTTTLFCPFSPTPSVSSKPNNSASGIVWAIENPNKDNPTDCGDTHFIPAVLHAFNATTLQETYNSSGLTNVQIGYAKGFATPTVFQGQVYMGTSTGPNNNLPGLYVFGLCGVPSACIQ